MKFFTCVAFFLLMTSTCMSQDNVKLLAGGKKIRGEIVSEDKTTVTIITRLGERQVIERLEIEKIRRGRPVSKLVLARLHLVDQTNADQVFSVAQWASPKGSLKSDAKRLARRTLAINPEHGAARKMLGHVKSVNVWHENAKKAELAAKKFFRAEGRTKFNGGWALKGDVDEIQANPEAWMLVKLRWHLTQKIMTARGYLFWNGDWISPEEKGLISIAKSILERSKIATHLAKIGPNRVWHYRSRKHAQEIAKLSSQTREWAAKTFAEPSFVRSPSSFHVVLESASQFQTFLYENRDIHGYSRVGADRHKSILGFLAYYLTFDDFGGVLRLRGGKETRNLMVWDMGRGFCRFAWRGRQNRLPHWLTRAASVHAEIAVMGQSDVTQYEESDYDRKNTHQLEDGTHKAAHATTLRDLNAGKPSTVRDLFSASYSTLSNKQLTWGTVLLSYLLDQRKTQFEAYMQDDEKKMSVEDRFTKHYGESLESMQEKFVSWIRAIN